jgi:hypothetical protein
MAIEQILEKMTRSRSRLNQVYFRQKSEAACLALFLSTGGRDKNGQEASNQGFTDSGRRRCIS